MRFAADAARITDGRASSEDRKHTSGGVFMAVDSDLGAEQWHQSQVRVFSVYFWQTEEWTPQNEPRSVEASQSQKTSMAGGI